MLFNNMMSSSKVKLLKAIFSLKQFRSTNSNEIFDADCWVTASYSPLTLDKMMSSFLPGLTFDLHIL